MKKPGRIFGSVLLHVSLLITAAVVLVPFAWLVTASLKPREAFFSGLFLPLDKDGTVMWSVLTLNNFVKLFAGEGLFRSAVNSLFLASSTAVIATMVCAAGGYALACHRFPGRTAIMLVVLGALIIPTQLLLAPQYQWLEQLGLLNTYAAVIFPAATPAFGVFLFRQAALQSIPPATLEAARIDGCRELGLFFTIALPMMRPMVGAFLLITFLATWNNFITPQVLLHDESLLPLSVKIAQLRGVYNTDYGLMMAGTLASIAPVMVLFMFLQREFISGLTSGAVKG